MRSLVNNLFRTFRSTKTARPCQQVRHRASLQVEGLENRVVLSTFGPLAPVGFQPLAVLGQHQTGISPAESQATGQSLPIPIQIRTAYNINNSPATGAGQTIAIVDPYNDPKIFGDLDTFDKQFNSSPSVNLFSQFGAASSFLTVYNQDGQVINPAGNTGIPVDSTGRSESEESMDVEWAHAIAPGAKIDLVETNSNSGPNWLNDGDLYQGVATAKQLPGVSVVSMSWGAPEFGSGFFVASETTHDGLFTSPGGLHPGVTFVASTGDNGSVSYPAASPNVVAVGGTTLTLNSDFTIQSETAWSTGSDSWNHTLGTGGGTSTQENEPSYQLGFQSTGKRTIPDVSFDADPNTAVSIFDSFGGSAVASGLTGGAGTSLAAPCWAGLIAMANQQRVAADLPTLNTTSPTQTQTLLYSLSNVAFHDITKGSITANGQTYNAGPGYDEVTGLGSPIANVLVDRLSNTLHLAGDQNPGNLNDTIVFGKTSSGGLQVTINGATQSFAPGMYNVVYLNAGAGVNNVTVTGLPAGVGLVLDNTTHAHNDIVTIGTSQTSLSNIAGGIEIADSGGTTSLTVDGTGDNTGRTYTINSAQVRVSGTSALVTYFGGTQGDVNSLAINGGSGNNTMYVQHTAAGVPVSINAGSGNNNIFVCTTNSALNISGNGDNGVILEPAQSLGLIAGPVNITSYYNWKTGRGRTSLTINDTYDRTGHNYTISSSAIEVQDGPMIDLGAGVMGVTIVDAPKKANDYVVDSVLNSDPITIDGDPLDQLSGPAAAQVTFNNHAHS